MIVTSISRLHFQHSKTLPVLPHLNPERISWVVSLPNPHLQRLLNLLENALRLIAEGATYALRLNPPLLLFIPDHAIPKYFHLLLVVEPLV
jgi:hypothetical protein